MRHVRDPVTGRCIICQKNNIVHYMNEGEHPPIQPTWNQARPNSRPISEPKVDAIAHGTKQNDERPSSPRKVIYIQSPQQPQPDPNPNEIAQPNLPTNPAIFYLPGSQQVNPPQQIRKSPETVFYPTDHPQTTVIKTNPNLNIYQNLPLASPLPPKPLQIKQSSDEILPHTLQTPLLAKNSNIYYIQQPSLKHQSQQPAVIYQERPVIKSPPPSYRQVASPQQQTQSPLQRRYQEYDYKTYRTTDLKKKQCLTAVIACCVLALLLALILALYFGITAAQKQAQLNAPQNRVAGGYTGGYYINGVYVVPVTSKPSNTYLIEGAEMPCNPNNNNILTPQPYYPNCQDVTTVLVQVTWTTTTTASSVILASTASFIHTSPFVASIVIIAVLVI